MIGAGPFGLAAAAHLTSANIATRVFGEPMSFWRNNMPEGMKLRSPWVASHIAHPNEEHALDAYAAMRDFAPMEQMPINEFIRYGCWFQAQAVPDLDTRKVALVEPAQHGFRVRLDDGEIVQADRVVVAMGLARQDFRPAPFAGLPSDLVSHSSDHVSFNAYRGRRVAVIGRGQSACESAALLSEAGADVQLISRGPVLWLGSEQDDGSQRRDLAWRVRKLMMTRGAVGPFPLNWLAESPGLVRLLGDDMRDDFSARCLRAKASGWLRPRFGAVQINAGQTISGARTSGNRVTLDLVGGSATFDHVLLATGYKIDIARLGILAPALVQGVANSGGAPRLSYGMESSVPGLHFVGASSAHSFGPLMRFVWGAGYAARAVTRRVAANRAQPAALEPDHVEMFTRSPKTLTRT
ncbi:MAG: SidA/IucD/PvdA family monooxygenase [Rhizobiales bacterium]|nr:SidA/IucD/PvdA family monooxygenase [Hyphomicrobiales bacterium]